MKEKPIYEQLGYDPDPPFYAPTSKPVVTNYDLLIRKSPEELAEYHTEMCGCPPGHDPIFCGMATIGCKGCWLNWLKEEAKE